MMMKQLVIIILTSTAVFCACSPNNSNDVVEINPQKDELANNSVVSSDFKFVTGGAFKNTTSKLFGTNATIASFYLGKHEVTQKEWVDVMGSNPSKFKGDNLPIEFVSWYDCVEYCNKRSIKEGLAPYYTIDKSKKDPRNNSDLDDMKWTVTINEGTNGYRLPTEAEWDYAAGGGQQSKSYIYSGSNVIDEVAWYWQNAGDKALSGAWSWAAIEQNNTKTKQRGGKIPNELGLYDMSGNVREWCEDWFEDETTPSGIVRVWRGGGWIGADLSCKTSYRGSHQANGKGPDQGLRLCRSK